MGILKQDLEKVFDCFYRAENAVSVGGTGLDLAIPKRKLPPIKEPLRSAHVLKVRVPIKQTIEAEESNLNKKRGGRSNA